jgi:hypothetical protein
MAFALTARVGQRLRRQLPVKIGLLVLRPKLILKMTRDDVYRSKSEPSPLDKCMSRIQRAEEDFDQTVVLTPGLTMGHVDGDGDGDGDRKDDYCPMLARKNRDRAKATLRKAFPLIGHVSLAEANDYKEVQWTRDQLTRDWHAGSMPGATEQEAHFAAEIRKCGARTRPYTMAALSAVPHLRCMINSSMTTSVQITVLTTDPWPLMAGYLGGTFGTFPAAHYRDLSLRISKEFVRSLKG